MIAVVVTLIGEDHVVQHAELLAHSPDALTFAFDSEHQRYVMITNEVQEQNMRAEGWAIRSYDRLEQHLGWALYEEA